MLAHEARRAADPLDGRFERIELVGPIPALLRTLCNQARSLFMRSSRVLDEGDVLA